MKNILKFFILVIVVLAMWYAIIAIFYFLFTGEFMGVVAEVGAVLFSFGYAFSLIGASCVLDAERFWD